MHEEYLRRSWTNGDGSSGEAWVVDYVDQHSKRHTKAFSRKRDADAYHAAVGVEVLGRGWQQ
jgi:hypothetical protein